jgi:hypothetical protein
LLVFGGRLVEFFAEVEFFSVKLCEFILITTLQLVILVLNLFDFAFLVEHRLLALQVLVPVLAHLVSQVANFAIFLVQPVLVVLYLASLVLAVVLVRKHLLVALIHHFSIFVSEFLGVHVRPLQLHPQVVNLKVQLRSVLSLLELSSKLVDLVAVSRALLTDPLVFFPLFLVFFAEA